MSSNKQIDIELKVGNDSGNVNEKKPCFPVRYYLAIVSAFTMASMFAVRNCLNVAIVSMTYDEQLEVNLKNRITSENGTISIEPTIEKFHWTASQEGLVLGAYFYGYASFQIVTGVLADKFNVVRLNIACGIMASALTALIPMAARAGVVYIFIVRVILGIVHSPIIALILVLSSKWFPPDEVVLPISLLNFGCNIGTAAVMPYTAWLCDQVQWGGWPMVFYSLAVINLIIPIVWITTVTPTPNTHPFISKYEVNLINKANQSIGQVKMKVSWLSIFSSIKIWTIIVVKACLAIGYMIINTKIPAYFESELGMDLASNGNFNSYLYVAIAVSNISAGPIFKYLIKEGYLSRTVARKVAENVAILFPGLSLLSIPFIGLDATLIKTLLIISMLAMGFQTAGDGPLVSEVAPDLAGSVFGICNTIASAAGFISPLLIGALLDSGIQHTRAWNIVFFIGAGAMIFGGLQFIVFAKSEAEPWGIAPSRSTDSLSTVVDTHRKHRPRKIQVHPVFSRQTSVA